MKDIRIFIVVLATFLCSFFGWLQSTCQVINDNIENRLELKMNEPRQSSTTDCTLQWSCLDHVRTKKLIQYHNDQWFFFNATDSNRHFINISAQDCRDLRGVQLMLIHGEACKPAGYELLECISLGDQDDIFMKLDNLNPDWDYLVLIDGYLHDNCGFEIELSDTPRGMPVDETRAGSMNSMSTIDFLMEINWSVSDSIAEEIRQYDVYRRKDTESKSELVYQVEQGFNARGVPLLDYSFEDVLPDYGKYNYQIIGVGDNDRVLISKTDIIYSSHRRSDVSSTSQDDLTEDPSLWLELALDYPKACKLNISIFDASTQNLLMKSDFVYNSINIKFKTDIKAYKAKGIFSYRIEIVNVNTNEKRSHLIMK